MSPRHLPAGVETAPDGAPLAHRRCFWATTVSSIASQSSPLTIGCIPPLREQWQSAEAAEASSSFCNAFAGILEACGKANAYGCRHRQIRTVAFLFAPFVPDRPSVTREEFEKTCLVARSDVDHGNPMAERAEISISEEREEQVKVKGEGSARQGPSASAGNVGPGHPSHVPSR